MDILEDFLPKDIVDVTLSFLNEGIFLKHTRQNIVNYDKAFAEYRDKEPEEIVKILEMEDVPIILECFVKQDNVVDILKYTGKYVHQAKRDGWYSYSNKSNDFFYFVWNEHDDILYLQDDVDEFWRTDLVSNNDAIIYYLFNYIKKTHVCSYVYCENDEHSTVMKSIFINYHLREYFRSFLM